MRGKFDWDGANRNHLAAHRIAPEEVEEVFSRFYVEDAPEPVDGEERILAHGTTAKGRFLTIAFTERKQKIGPVTGWDMEPKDVALYVEELNKNY